MIWEKSIIWTTFTLRPICRTAFYKGSYVVLKSGVFPLVIILNSAVRGKICDERLQFLLA